jgi:hypothetical protein
LATKELAFALRQRTISHFIFRQRIFDHNYHDCAHHPPYFSVFPRLKIKLKGRQFDTAEVMEAELQVLLNGLTEHGFQDAFKNGRNTGNGAYARGRIIFMGDGGQ